MKTNGSNVFIDHVLPTEEPKMHYEIMWCKHGVRKLLSFDKITKLIMCINPNEIPHTKKADCALIVAWINEVEWEFKTRMPL